MNGDSSHIIVDAEQVGRAFANIISNSIQSISRKGELRISTGIDGGYAWAKFEDTGCGIPEENMEKIFEPLFTTKSRGIGLGLAITRRLIEQNGGIIKVKSQAGRGTILTIRLPLQQKEVDKKREKATQHTGS